MPMPYPRPARCLLLALVVMPALLQGCSGGSSTVTPPPPPPPPPPQFTVGGTVSGLNGTVELSLNAGAPLVVANDGGFGFVATLANGTAYEVTLLQQPVGQTCALANASGTIAAANITDIAVTCVDDLYTVGGTVSGFAGGSLELQLNDADLLEIPGNGAFTFATTLVNGAPYEIAVTTQPAGQICSIPDGNHSGIIAAANVTDILVHCLPDAGGLGITPLAIKTLRLDWTPAAGTTGYRLLENPDGVSGFSEIASLDGDAQSHDHRVFLPGRISASYLLEACADDDCTESPVAQVTGTLREAIGYFKASTPGAGDLFGTSITLSADGRILAVGAWGEANESGAVYIFVRTDDLAWQTQGRLVASNAGNGDFFGYSVALSADGDTLAVGAWGEDGDAPGSGAAYVFVRDGDDWSEQGIIKAPQPNTSDLFGYSVALAADGATLVIGAPGDSRPYLGIDDGPANDCDALPLARDNCKNFGSGAVHVYTKDADAWQAQALLKASTIEAGDRFGWSVALSADGAILAVGADFEDSNAIGVGSDQTNNSAANSGAVYVFTRSANDWSQQAYLKASNTGAGDQFGFSVALDHTGTTLVVGAPREDGNGSGTYAAPPHGAEDNDDAPVSGAVYVFVRDEAVWTQQGYIKASNTGAGDQFGTSVSLSADGAMLAVGASGEDGNATGIYPAPPHGGENNEAAADSGASYVFVRDSGAWRQQAFLKASNTRAEDAFGIAVALSGDGQSLAVGAIREGSGAADIGGDQVNDCALPEANRQNCALDSGAVYLY